MGVVAGRRIGGSVARNRAKRRIREALARVRLVEGVDYIVIASREVNEAAFEQLVGWIDEATTTSEE